MTHIDSFLYWVLLPNAQLGPVAAVSQPDKWVAHKSRQKLCLESKVLWVTWIPCCCQWLLLWRDVCSPPLSSGQSANRASGQIKKCCCGGGGGAGTRSKYSLICLHCCPASKWDDTASLSTCWHQYRDNLQSNSVENIYFDNLQQENIICVCVPRPMPFHAEQVQQRQQRGCHKVSLRE